MSIGAIWDLIFLNPAVNVLIVLSKYLFNDFGLTIIVLTIIVNLLLYPLTRKQLEASKKMQDLQGRVAEIRKKYAKDRQRAAEEQMKLFKESGVSYAGCLLPMIIQFPVWVVLYQSILRVMAVSPEDFLNLSARLYSSWGIVFTQLPLAHGFLWMDLSSPDLIMALLTGASMWVQQKMMTPTNMDPQQRAQNEMMQWMMPLMFAFFGMSFPSGLAVYWVTSTVIRSAMQYRATGWGSLVIPGITNRGDKSQEKEIKGRVIRSDAGSKKPESPADRTGADIVIKPEPAKGEIRKDGKSGSKRQDGGRGGPKGSRRTEGRAGRG